MELKNIMIVDDSRTSRLIIKRCFEIAGYHDTRYIEAEDGLDALTVLNDNPVDMIVSDLNMPKIDGISLVKKLKQNEKTAPIHILIISSMDNEILINELKSLGIFGFINKPISPAKILEVLGERNG